jgi:hypothetical protein
MSRSYNSSPSIGFMACSGKTYLAFRCEIATNIVDKGIDVSIFSKQLVTLNYILK